MNVLKLSDQLTVKSQGYHSTYTATMIVHPAKLMCQK